MQSLSERTAGFTDSVIRRMTRVSMQYGAVNLSQGFPDFEPPKEILDRMAQVAYEDFHQYSITWGSQNFREALAAKQSRCMGRKIDPNTEIVTTCGSTEAMMAAMMTVTNPGDKVIIFSPFYENYGADTILSGAEPIYVPLVPPDFHFDPAVLEDAFRQHPKAMILCNPSNPCGKVFTRMTSPTEPVIIGIGCLNAGTTYNAVAEHAVMEGTTRTVSQESRDRIRRLVTETADSIAAIYGGTAEIVWTDFAAALINDAEVCREAAAVADSLLGEGHVVTDRELSLSGDNFAEFELYRPGAYAYLGTGNPDKPHTVVSNHNGGFDVDEDALVTGAALYAGYALARLG